MRACFSRVAELLLGRGEPFLHLQALAQIGEEADRSDRLVFVEEQRGRQRHRDALAGLAEHLAAVVLELARAAEHAGLDEAHDLARHAGRIELGDVHLADHLVGQIAVAALRGAVEEQHAAFHVGGDDGVDRAVDHALQEVLGLRELGLGGALLGDVAEGEENGVLFAQNRARVHAEQNDVAVFLAEADVDALRDRRPARSRGGWRARARGPPPR